jgi:hydroxymethylpyrimidine/phosphomethylpyrimidine kinase
MNDQLQEKPVVLVFAGHDPSGGAGIQADIETMAALGCIATSVITSLTAQNTQLFSNHLPQTKSDFVSQTKLVLDDINIDACKIGAVGSPELIRAIHQIIADNKSPVVLDPILHSTTGHEFANEEMSALFCELLLPIATVITPNRDEATQLTGELHPQAAAEKFLVMGCKNILITDAEESTTQVINHLYQRDGRCQTFTWERLPGSFHGSGCTLASAIAANLAKNIELISAVQQAQDFTWNSLKHGLQLGKGQLHPNRFFNHKKTQ